MCGLCINRYRYRVASIGMNVGVVSVEKSIIAAERIDFENGASEENARQYYEKCF